MSTSGCMFCAIAKRALLLNPSLQGCLKAELWGSLFHSEETRQHTGDRASLRR